MTTQDVELRNLKSLIKELKGFRGRHTELVTVYVPSGYNINKVVEQISNEKSTAMNIKSKTTKNNVIDALDKILGHLRVYKKTPDNGLAIFCGNISKFEGGADIELWGIEPPDPVRTKLYRCDQIFIFEPLEELLEEKEIYGFIVIDTNEAAIGLLKGKHMELVKKLGSMVPGKTEAGGWSQQRYARIREEKLHGFMKKVGAIATEKFKEFKEFKGLIIGGPGPVKEKFAEGEFIDHELNKKLLGVVDTSDVGEVGLREALNRSEELLSDASVMAEKKILTRFFSELGKDSGLVVYGIKETIEALGNGVVQILLLTEDIDWVKVNYKCGCGNVFEKIIDRNLIESQKCPKCGESPIVDKQEDMVHEMIKKAESMGTEVEMMSWHTGEGEQFKALGGIGGILRFSVKG